MKLLIITQAINQNNPVLGFFATWVAKFGERCEKTTVICLEKGEHQLPSATRVFSLGKEEGVNRWRYLWRFGQYLWQERSNYDTVFVHMNQEYVLLAGWWWRLTGKRVWFWRNHRFGNWLTRLAVWLSHRVFCTSRESFTAQFRKTEIMPVGIDTDRFTYLPGVPRKPHSILALGRLSRVKRLEILLRALLALHGRGKSFLATIVGSPITPDDCVYERELRLLGAPLEQAGVLSWRASVPHSETPEWYASSEIYVNLTPSGSFDKTIFEAMSCGAIPVINQQSEVVGLPEELEQTLGLSEAEKTVHREKLIEQVRIKHSLDRLAQQLITC